jgi:Tol biopolymer transport system component
VHAVRLDSTPLPFPPILTGAGAYRFTPDGKKLIFLPIHDARDFQVLDLATQKTRPLTNISARAPVGAFDVTSDGRSIVFDRTERNADIVLIERPTAAPR